MRRVRAGLARLLGGGRSRPSAGPVDLPGRRYSVGEPGPSVLSPEEVAALGARFRAVQGQPARWISEHGPELTGIPDGKRLVDLPRRPAGARCLSPLDCPTCGGRLRDAPWVNR